MSYQVLARKWRPRTFKELVGQVHVLQALINALDSGRLHHAYLFTGTRGVGKTTIARILAKCLNCETGVTSEPCGQCSACQEIDEGRFVDLIEVDAASRTKVEDTRELLDNVQYAPTRGRFKIYLIDEVHMLSPHSFNALLKTLEEPPPHVKFLLATTDPQKLPITILSRCLQFSLKNMSPEKVVGHLQDVLDKEGIQYESSALWQLGRAADGSMRDALSLTDQAIAFCDNTITEQGVSAMLGTIDRSQVLNVVSALATGDASNVLNTVAGLAEHGPDYASVLADMLSVLHRVAIAQAVPDAVDNSQGDRENVLSLARQMTSEDVQLYYQSGLIGRRDLPLSPDPRTGFEMVMLRMLAFRPDGVPVAPVQPLQQGRAPAGQMDSSPAVSTPEQSEREEPEPAVGMAQEVPEPVQQEPVQQESAPSHVVDPDAFNALAAESIEQESSLQESVVLAEPVTVPPEPGFVRPEPEVAVILPEVVAPEFPVTPDATVPENVVPEPAAEEVLPPSTERLPLSALTQDSWIAVFQELPLAGVTRTIASYCLLEAVDGHRLTMVLDQNHDTLYNDTHRLRMETALSEYFGTSVTLAVAPGVAERETPAAWRERRRQERQQEAVNSIYADERVRTLVSTFSGTILDHTIEPVD
ncbi:DNA polymerase III subunit gamma/tau [Kistimonas scapharcae]|uniref:DNA polymerase III subunit gamma/tau n=1 Tax=Kistimonas scapharcae TaxID=1036133 RepID=A0ABP8UZN9_9GAMM